MAEQDSTSLPDPPEQSHHPPPIFSFPMRGHMSIRVQFLVVLSISIRVQFLVV